MCDLVSTVHVWEEKMVPKEWVVAIHILIPKKGDLWNCDNWRGIYITARGDREGGGTSCTTETAAVG